MKIKIQGIKSILKKTVFCISLLICIIFGLLSPKLQKEKQTLEIKSAAVISIGFGTAIGMSVHNRKKD